MTADEIWEECICDFLGDINIFSKSANGSLVVNELINQTQAITKEQKAEPNQTRGSPEAQGKASRDFEAVTKITTDMTEEERYEALKKRSINNIPLSKEISSDIIKKNLEISSWEDINKYLGREKRSVIKKIALEFSVLNKEYLNEDVGLTFEFSRNNFEESYSKQKRNYTNFAKMFSVFNEVIERAVGIEIHNRTDYKTDPTLNNIFVLVSAYQDGDYIVPVKLEVKQFKDKPNTLYVAISLKKIKKTEVSESGNTEIGVTQNSRSVNISISQIFEKINPIDKDFLKYIPDGFLNSEQKAAKQEALRKDADDAYMSAIKRNDMQAAQKMVDEAAKKAGYNINAYHGTRENFNEFLGGAFFTDDYFNADGYAAGERVIDAYLKIQNPLIIDAEGRKWDDLSSQYGSSTIEIVGRVGRLVDKINSLKYDGIIFENINDNWSDDVDFGSTETVYYIFDSKQAKSANSVTYDDDGNVIPLSERFNSESNDIRYSRELDALDYITPDEEFEAVDAQAFSNRSILANALLDTITSSEEYKLIRSYQEEIAQLDASDRKLAQLKKDLNQLYKQENPNFEVIRELNEKDYTICAKYTKKTLKNKEKH